MSSHKQIAFLNLSEGIWNDDVNCESLSGNDKFLIREYDKVKTFYPEDFPETGSPEHFIVDNTVSNWALYASFYANEDHLGINLAMKNILSEAEGLTYQEKFNTFDRIEQGYLLSFGAIINDEIGVEFYLGEEGFDIEIATDFYMSVNMNSMECVANSCLNRMNNRAKGWYPIVFSFYSQDSAFMISESVDNYQTNYEKYYIKYGIIGTQWGDSVYGLLDYIHGTSGISSKLEDIELLPGKNFEDVRDMLTEFFFKRWSNGD